MAKNQTQQTINVTVTPEELVKFQDEAFESLRRDLALPGFRQGTVSADVAKSHINPQEVFSEAIERAVAKKGTEAIEDVADRIVGRPEVRVTKAAPDNPLEFSIDVHLLPELDMSDWRQLRIPLKPEKVSDEDIEKSLVELQNSRAKTQAVNRAAQKDDLVDVGFIARVDGVKVEGGETKSFSMVLGDKQFIDGFDEAVIGMERGGEKTVSLPFPKDWGSKHLAGKIADFEITLNNVLERVLPELNDDFAKGMGQYETLDQLKGSIKEGLELERTMQEKQRVRREAVNSLGKGIKDTEIPEPVVLGEIEQMKAEMKQQIEAYGMEFDKYLEELGKKEEELVADWRKSALDRVRSTLVIRAIARAENVTPDDKAVEERSKTMIKHQQAMGTEAAKLDPDRVRSYTETIVINEMTLDMIEGVVTGEDSE